MKLIKDASGKFLTPKQVKALLKEHRNRVIEAERHLTANQQAFKRSQYQERTNAHAPLGLIALTTAIKKHAVLSEHEPVLLVLRTYTPGLLNYWLQKPM